MRRAAPLRRRTRLKSSPLRRRQPWTSKRRLGTGPSTGTVEACLERSGYSCEIRALAACVAGDGMLGDVRGVDWSAHHRRPRRAGGSKDPRTNSAAALLIACGSGTTGCHGWVESHRADAYAAGWLLRAGTAPSSVPVLIVDSCGVRRRVLLTDDGRYAPAPTEGSRDADAA